MQNISENLERLLEEMPLYASWRVAELQQLFFRYGQLITALAASDENGKHKWPADYVPDLHDRIKVMLLEKEPDKQSRQFNNIASELQEAIVAIRSKVDSQ